MEIKNLITFTKVAEAQSLSKAARMLGYAQSTVTMQMQQLEQELGVPLYERVGKQIRITQAGQELLTYAVPIIKMSREALQIGKGEAGMSEEFLRLGILEVLAGDGLAGRMDAYVRANPRTRLEVRTESETAVLLELLRHNEIDMMLVLDYPLTDVDLVHAGEDKPEQVHFFAAKGHPLEGVRSLDLETLLEYPLIRGAGSLSYEQELDRLVMGREPRQFVVQNPDLALRMAARQSDRGEDAGIVLAPDCAAREYVESERLVALDYEIPGCRIWQQTIYHRNKWLTASMNGWITMVEDRR